MTRQMVPITELGGVLQEQGRIRLGVKTGPKGRPKSLETFRFTSPDRTVIEKLAEIYGGTAKPWSDPKANNKNQWEVISKADEIEVWVGTQGVTQWYEFWTNAGCIRRCDGVVCETRRGDEAVQIPCVCNTENGPTDRDRCKPKTRMTVIIPQVRMAGGWRIETSSWNAAKEMPQMEQLLRSLESAGLARAKLKIEHGQSKSGGTTKRFTFPRLILDETPEAIMGGATDVRQLVEAQVSHVDKSLPSGPTVIDEVIEPNQDPFGNYVAGDVIEDAEIVVEGWDSIEDAKASGVAFKANKDDGPKFVPV